MAWGGVGWGLVFLQFPVADLVTSFSLSVSLCIAVDTRANAVARCASVSCSVVTTVACAAKSSARTVVRNVTPSSASACARTARTRCLVPKEVPPAVPSGWLLGNTIKCSKTEGSLANQPPRPQGCGTLTNARVGSQLPAAQARRPVRGLHGAAAT